MTKITYEFSGLEFSMAADGHAGFADMGNDIVCAGISVLVQSLIEYLPFATKDFDYSAEPGHVRIKAKGYDAVVCARMTIAGLEVLQSQYPRHIQLTEECPRIYKI